jgi:hypothetical protein
MTTVNVDLLRRTLDHIETHPDEWDQSTFLRDGRAISEVAQDVLGLSHGQANALFVGVNTLTDLRGLVATLIAGDECPART